MKSIKNYFEETLHKDAIVQILKTTFTEIPEEDYEEITEMIAYKLAYMNHYRDRLEMDGAIDLGKTAKAFGVPKKAIIDSFVYFTLIVDNVLLQKELAQYLPEEDDK